LSAPFEEKNAKGFFFGDTFEKIRGLQILATPLKKKPEFPLSKNWPSHIMIWGRGVGGEGRDKNGTPLVIVDAYCSQ